ncbi:MAG: hypothetical protein GSR75_02705 [Desulfurococcales archaeon]|nr:hypothetical protein [Desulfurococcales archaeon]
MVVTVEITGMLEEILDALVASGLYNNKSEAVRDAIRRLGENLDLTHLAFKVYSSNREMSFTRALNVSRLGFKETIVYFIRKGYAPELGVINEEELKNLPPLHGEFVLDYTSMEIFLETGFIEYIPRIMGIIDFVVPKSLEEQVKQLPLRYGLAYKRLLRLPGFKVVSERVSTSMKGWLSESEAEALRIARNRGIPIISCDIRFRKQLRINNIRSIPGLGLAYMTVRKGLVQKGFWPVFISRAAAIPIYVPPVVEKIV